MNLKSVLNRSLGEVKIQSVDLLLLSLMDKLSLKHLLEILGDMLFSIELGVVISGGDLVDSFQFFNNLFEVYLV